MTANFTPMKCYYLLRPAARQLFFGTDAAVSGTYRKSPNVIFHKLIEKPQPCRSLHKSAALCEESDSSSLVVAYNLSDKFINADLIKLSHKFAGYQINPCLPKDVQQEVVLLSSTKNKGSQNSSKEVNDVFLFQEGSIVFWGVPYDQQKRILYGLSSIKVNPNDSELIQDEKEHMNFELSDTIDRSRLSRDTIHIAVNQEASDIKLDKFAFSHAIALSVKLGIRESQLDEYIKSVEFITTNMKEGKDIALSKSEIFKKTGEILCLKHSINLSSDLLDLPDVYWDRSRQEDMFSSMFAYLNIRKRTNVMNEKLNNCCELMNVLANFMNDCHHVRLEWMIIALISVEVFFELVRFL